MRVAIPDTGTERGLTTTDVLMSLLVSIAASVIAHYICKWLDGGNV